MDRNTLSGLLLIGIILVGYSYWTKPSDAEVEVMQRKRDSIEQVQALQAEEEAKALTEEAQAEAASQANDSIPVQNDSILQVQNQEKFGLFATAANGKEELVKLENEKIEVFLSNRGGKPVQVRLKEYTTGWGDDLIIWDQDSSNFGFKFVDGNRFLNTEELFFKPSATEISVEGEELKTLSMKLFAGSKDKYIEYRYTLTGNSYLLDYTINFQGLADLAAQNANKVDFLWSLASPNKEKSIKTQNMYTTVFWKYQDDDSDYITETSAGKEELEEPIDWIALKQQFFSATIMSDAPISSEGAFVKTVDLSEQPDGKYVKRLTAGFPVMLSKNTVPSANYTFFLGPNKYDLLTSYDRGLDQQIDLGWGIFGWTNEYLIIPVFNLLESLNISYGIIILLLTIFIKIILFPLVWKNYVSSAKMRVLKPEMDVLNEKFKDADPMKKQQEVMGLYRQAGVNPLAGCVPMILQAPILYAMFRFFPSAIELRQKSFLWAEDLSTYDSVLELGFSIPFYGDHISLFTLLMAISLIFYSRTNMQLTPQSGAQATQMKVITYLMPVMLLLWFNDYASGLSYYYFTANVVSMLQMFVIKKWFINEEAIHAKIQEKRENNKVKKKSRFQQQMEDMAKKRGYKLPK